MTPLERTLTGLRDLLIAGVLLAAPLIWGSWGTPQSAFGLAAVFGAMTVGWLAWLAAALFARRELTWVRTPLNLPVVLLLAVALLSTALVSVNRCRSSLQVYQFLSGAMLFALIANQPAATWRRRVYVGALILGAAVTSWLGGREYVVESVIGKNPSWRIFARFVNPNELAGFLGLVLPLAVAAFLSARALAPRIVIAFAALLMLIALVLTGSRGGWAAFIVGIFVFGLLAGAASKRTRLAVAVGVGALVLIALVALAMPPLRIRLLGSLSGQQSSDMFRVLTWQGTERMIRANPWLGIGPGAFEFAYPMYATGGFTRMAHQNYLQTAAEMGVPGLIAFLWVLATFFWLAGKGFRRLPDRESRLLCAACIGGVLMFAVHSFLEYSWYIGAIELTLFALFGLAAHALAAPQLAAAPPAAAGPKRKGRAPRPEPAPAAPGLIVPMFALRRRRLALNKPAAWATLVVAGGVAALAVAYPVRAYLAEQQSVQGRMARARGDLALAEVSYRAAVELMPGCGEYHRELGSVLSPPRGIEQAELAVELEPTNALNHAVLARFYEIVGPWDKAAAEYRQAIELNRNYLLAYRGLAELEARLGRPAEALALYRDMIAIENSPYERYKALEERVEAEYAYAHYALGRVAFERGDAQNARVELERALAILKQRETQSASLRRAFQAAGYGMETEGELARLRARILWRLAQLWERAGDLAKADSLRIEARRLAPEVAAVVQQEPSLTPKGGKSDAASRSSPG